MRHTQLPPRVNDLVYFPGFFMFDTLMDPPADQKQ